MTGAEKEKLLEIIKKFDSIKFDNLPKGKEILELLEKERAQIDRLEATVNNLCADVKELSEMVRQNSIKTLV